MATGPVAISRCLNTYVPPESDVVLIGYMDMCFGSFQQFWNSTFGMHLEVVVRELRRRPDPPAIVLFNFYRWLDLGCLSRGVCRYWEQCEAAFNELARFYDVSAISVRDALYRTAHAVVRDHVPYQFMRWTTNWGTHFDGGDGDRMASEMVVAWVRGAVERARPPMPWSEEHEWLGLRFGRGPGWDRRPQDAFSRAIAQSSGWGEATSTVLRSTSCFSFDDGFDQLVAPPTVVRQVGWQMVQYERGTDAALKLKPGLRASRRGAYVDLDTQSTGAHHSVAIGFLQSEATAAVAQLSCVPPCACSTANISAHTTSSRSTTQHLPPHAFEAPLDSSCQVRLTLLTDGEPFKLVSMQVLSTHSGGGYW